MKLNDLFQMSASNLFKRKIRTVLTVLGVVIGIASIVVMMSLGIGLRRSTINQIKEYGSLTVITVNEPYNQENISEKEKKRLNDALIAQLGQMEYVKSVAPVLNINAIAKYGVYEANLSIYATTPEELQNRNIKVGQGQLPEASSKELQLFYGNQVIVGFQNAKTQRGYYDTGELPDIDLIKDHLFYIFDTEAYYASKNPSQGDGATKPARKAKKYQIQVSGVEAGSVETYTNNSYNVFCDINQLLPVLKKEFRKRAIPGQPVTKNNKPYKELYYSSLVVNVDDMNHVSEVNKAITGLGYVASNNMEWVESQQKQMNMIQAVLGGIGAVSMLVAAIGITNTMMMSIYERTKEIGIMKVLGCDMLNIGEMFLIEAGMIGLIGGVIGNVLSYGISGIVNYVVRARGMGYQSLSYIPGWLVIAAMGFAVMIGMFAGFFPARRAMKLSPLAAIRNE